MAFAEIYRRQVALLIRALPLVTEEACFAMKGGTAINLFVRDLPRLSVDIDLTYLPVAPRSQSLTDINAAMKRIAGRIKATIAGAQITESVTENTVVKLTVRAGGVQIKIEVTPVLRGCVFEPEIIAVKPAVQEEFGFAEARIVSFEDLYAGKIVAALDRQHPRDLFDVCDLLANEGISDELRRAFIVYLVSSNRPFAEILAPTRLDIAQEFARGFDGMTDSPVTLDDLIQAREHLIAEIVGKMPIDHRRFLLSLKKGEPEWPVLGVPGAEALPAVRWRLENLAKIDKKKRDALIERLREVLQL